MALLVIDPLLVVLEFVDVRLSLGKCSTVAPIAKHPRDEDIALCA
jgi:hypothetical protein